MNRLNARIPTDSLAFLMILLLTCVGGCTQQTLQSLDGAPDGDAEILSLESAGTEEIQTAVGKFREVIEQPGRVVLVEFWGPHCGPCLHMVPILERIVEKFPDKVSVVKVDLESMANQELGAYFGVHAIPEIRMFVDGQPAGAVHGYVNATELTRELQPALTMLDSESGT